MVLYPWFRGEEEVAEYFEQVLNVEDVRDSNINVIGDRRLSVLGKLGELARSIEEVMEALKDKTSGKALGLDGFPVECFKKGGRAVLEWLVRLVRKF